MTKPPKRAFRRLALFDLDGTILRGNSWQGFYLWMMKQRPDWAPGLFLDLLGRYSQLYDGRSLRQHTLLRFKGMKSQEMDALGDHFFKEWALARLRPGAIKTIQHHRNAGDLTVLLTASFDFLARPIAQHLELDQCLSSRLRYDGKNFSGQLVDGELRGEAKLKAIMALPAETPIDWAGSSAYGDEDSDFALLSQVGHPFYIGRTPPPKLSQIQNLQCAHWDHD